MLRAVCDATSVGRACAGYAHTWSHSRPKRARYFLRRSASFGLALAFRAELGEQITEIRFDVLRPIDQAGQRISPQVNARLEILAKSPGHLFARQIAVGAGDQLKVALRFMVGADREKAFFFDRFEQHGLFVGAQPAYLVKKQQTWVRAAQQAGAIGGGARERPPLAKQG